MTVDSAKERPRNRSSEARNVLTPSSTDTGAQREFSYLLASLSSAWTPKQATAVTYMLKLLIPEPSIDTLRQLVDDKDRSASASIFTVAIVRILNRNDFLEPPRTCIVRARRRRSSPRTSEAPATGA